MNIRESTFREKMISQDDVVKLFDDLDNQLYKIILYVCHISTNYICSYLIDMSASVMNGTSGNKGIFYKSQYEIEKYKQKDKTSNDEIIKKSYIEFSNKCLKFINAISTENPKPDQIVKLLRQSCFFRAVIEEAIMNFMSDSDAYLKLSSQLSTIYNKINKDNDQKLWIDYSSISIKMQHIEEKIGIDRDKLYGCFTQVSEMLKKATEISHTILFPYLRSVYSVASCVSKDPSKFDNNYQNGIIGAVYAKGRFDQTMCKSFGAFLKLWSHQSILVSIKTDNFIKLPLNVWQTNALINKNRKNSAGIDLELVSNEEIAEETNLKLKQVKSVLDNIRLTHVYTLDHPVENDEGSSNTLLDSIEDKTSDDLNSTETVNSIIDVLTNNERKIICLMFGMVDHIKNNFEIHPKQVFIETIRQYLFSKPEIKF